MQRKGRQPHRTLEDGGRPCGQDSPLLHHPVPRGWASSAGLTITVSVPLSQPLSTRFWYRHHFLLLPPPTRLFPVSSLLPPDGLSDGSPSLYHVFIMLRGRGRLKIRFLTRSGLVSCHSLCHSYCASFTSPKLESIFSSTSGPLHMLACF